jgi:hypothetical protein
VQGQVGGVANLRLFGELPVSILFFLRKQANLAD